jgi:DNA-binding NtrC family response regulator
MRPRKLILIVDRDEERLGLMRFRLDNWGFAVTSACCAGEAAELLKDGHFDLLSLWLPLEGLEGLLDAGHADDPAMATLAICPGRESQGDLCVDAFYTYQPQPAELKERIKVLTARKRGPLSRKPPQRATVVLTPQTAREGRVA